MTHRISIPPMGHLNIDALLCSPEPSPKVCLPFLPKLSPGVDQLILEQQENRTHQVTEKRGQAKGKEEPGFVVLRVRSVNVLKENSFQGICASLFPSKSPKIKDIFLQSEIRWPVVKPT